MTWLDLVLLGVLALGIIHGWKSGFIIAAGNLLSLVASVVISAWLFSWLSSWHSLANFHIQHPVVAVIAFIVIMVVVVKLLRIIVKLLNLAYKLVSIIPGMGLINRVLGGVVGLAEAAVLLVIASYVFQNFMYGGGLVGPSDAYFNLVENGLVYPLFIRAAELLPQLNVWLA